MITQITIRSVFKQNPPFKLVTMLTNTLPVMLLAGAASAACPLSIAIAETGNHVVNVQVTNTGSETLQVFKGNTVFSAHGTKDLLVADAGVYTLSDFHISRNIH